MGRNDKDAANKTAATQTNASATQSSAAYSGAQTAQHAQAPASTPLPHAPASPRDELSALRAKLAEYENDLQRLAAEFDNYKKRVEKEKFQSRQYGKAEALAPFLDMNEVFEKALAHKGSGDAKAMHDGLLLLQKQLRAIFASSGVKEISCVGMPHHAFHEVMLQVPGGQSGEIAQVLRKGYMMGDYVLRPAQVSVYVGEEKKEEKDTAEKQKEEEKETKEKNRENEAEGKE